MSVRGIRLGAAAIAVIALLFTAVTSHGQPSEIDAALDDLRAGNYTSAFRAAERLAPDGDVIAQTMLGYLYGQGLGTDQDLPAADEWLTRAAEQGHIPAMTLLADLHHDDYYSLDDGQLRNRPLAVEWYRRAAEAGNSYAQRRLGVALVVGRGVDQDRAAGLAWMERSAEAGNRVAIYRLGFMYESGELGTPDVHKALDLYRRAIRLGEVKAARQAIELLRDEQSPVFDLEEAYLWALIARHWWSNDIWDGGYFVWMAETVHLDPSRMDPPDIARVTLGLIDEETFREEMRAYQEMIANPEKLPYRLDEAARRRSEEAAQAIIARWPEAPPPGANVDD